MPDEFAPQKWWNRILRWIVTASLLFAAALIIHIYVFRISIINGSSMQPNFQGGDTVFQSRLPYLFASPKRGDVVILDKEAVTSLQKRGLMNDITDSLQYNLFSQKLLGMTQEHKFWIKRVIGIEGDIISAQEGKLYRNGELLEEEYVLNPEYEYPDDFSFRIKKGMIFVMGDNREDSQDSRDIGVVPIENVLGKVIFC